MSDQYKAHVARVNKATDAEMAAALSGNDGGAAFPATVQGWNDRLSQAQPGMSLRVWFAGQALMSMLSAPDKISPNTFSIAAGLSYQFADAMLEARKVKP